MPDTRKSRRPALEPPRPSRDPRVDSAPPDPLDEAPLAQADHVAHTFSRPTLAPPSTRLASLEAEVERLQAERANDADDTAGMLVRLAESERMQITAHSLTVEAEARTGALEADLGEARRRVEELELEATDLREQGRLSEARLGAARETMAAALRLIEELERREEIAASIRTRAIRDALRALGGQPAASAAPESSVGMVGTHDPEWELDLAK